MDIVVNDKKKIADLKKEFNHLFPYLKVEFFSKPYAPNESFPEKYLIRDSGKTLGECRTVHNSGELSINGATTVTELERAFGEKFGLSVQVFRKSGKVWLETTVTDNWTLEMQNSQGQELADWKQNNIR